MKQYNTGNIQAVLEKDRDFLNSSLVQFVGIRTPPQNLKDNKNNHMPVAHLGKVKNKIQEAQRRSFKDKINTYSQMEN